MKTYEEIKDIIVNQYGIKDQESYWKYVQEKKNGITQEEVDRLSPDFIDNNVFWKVCSDLFGEDPICNTSYGNVKMTPMEANRRNFDIASSLGLIGFLQKWKHYSIPVLEIGSGYGSFRNWVEVNTSWTYRGVDADPKLKDIVSTTPEGFLPDSVKQESQKNPFYVAFSSNVFQHLSLRQRALYYKDIHNILGSDGYFVLSVSAISKNSQNIGSLAGYPCGDKIYCGHYGQFTEILTKEDEMNLFLPYFDICGFTETIGLIGVILRKKLTPEGNVNYEAK